MTIIEDLQLVELGYSVENAQYVLLIKERVTLQAHALIQYLGQVIVYCMAPRCGDCGKSMYIRNGKYEVHLSNGDIKTDVDMHDLAEAVYCHHKIFDTSSLMQYSGCTIILNKNRPHIRSYSLLELAHVGNPIWDNFNWVKYHASHKNTDPRYIVNALIGKK